MPKLKTRRSLAKRVRFTKKKKIKFYQSCKSHILTKKRAKRKRQLRRPGYVSASDTEAMRTMLPYGT